MKLRLLLPALVLPTLACGPTVLLPSDDTGSSGSDSTDPPITTTTTTPTPPPPPPPPTSTSTSTSTTDLDSSDDTTNFVGFISDDFPCVVTDDEPWHCSFIECDPFDQDCPRGEKCMPWANDGGMSWNAQRCSPVADNPLGWGETCTMEGSPYSGIDDCELGAMCWAVDPETLQGTCVPMCGGSELAPECPASTSCLIANDGVLTLCLPQCDPLASDCEADEVCVPSDADFVCAPTGTDTIAGDPCESINSCAAGLVCVDAPTVAPSCGGATGCCTPWCDLSAPDPSASCFDPAQDCVSWWQGETPPAGFETLGICAVPPA